LFLYSLNTAKPRTYSASISLQHNIETERLQHLYHNPLYSQRTMSQVSCFCISSIQHSQERILHVLLYNTILKLYGSNIYRTVTFILHALSLAGQLFPHSLNTAKPRTYSASIALQHIIETVR